MLLHYPVAGFQICTNPPPQDPPGFAAGVIDPDCGPEVWNWLPDVTFPDHFRAPAALSFRCWRTVAGHRVLVPVQPWEEFVRLGARYGVAVVERDDSPAAAESHAVMSLFAEKARHADVYLSRHFGHTSDLTTREEPGVLPSGLGVPPGEAGRGWAPRRLIAEGAQRLQAAGRPEASTAVRIAHGLHAAAQLSPVDPPATNLRPGAIRDALFADGEFDLRRNGLPEPLLEEVAVAIAETYRGRVGREQPDSPQSRDEALLVVAGIGRKDRFVDLVRGRVERRRPECRREEIDEAIREWYWRSLRYTSAAFSAAAGQFLSRAEQLGKLSSDEVGLFRLMYCSHDAYGGLALPVLFDRFDLLEPWLERMIAAPAEPRLDVLYTLLCYYAHMVRERRRVDTDAARNVVNGTDGAEAVARESGSTSTATVQDELDDVAARIASAEGYTCCDIPQWAGLSCKDMPSRFHETVPAAVARNRSSFSRSP